MSKIFLILQIIVQIYYFWWHRKYLDCTTFLDAQERHSWSILKANTCMFLNTPLKEFLFKRRSKALSNFFGGGMGERLNSFLKADRCLGFAKYFTIFHLKIKFLKIQLFFSISILLYIPLKRRNFSDNLDFKSKIAPKFLIRSPFLSL